MEGQAGRSVELVYRRSHPRAGKADRILPLVILAAATVALVDRAGAGRAVGVIFGGSVVLLPALLIGARRVRIVPGRRVSA